MIAQLDKAYIKARPQKILDRLVSYSLFEGRPITTEGRWINPLVFSLLQLQKKINARRPVDKPIFILGTGRSGTTLMGILLSLHQDVAYLNEPKAIWHSIFPNEDLIGNYTDDEKALYRLNRQHVTPDMTKQINNIYSSYLWLLNRKRVVDKYPEMIFRTEFLKEIFPDALFIIMARDGYNTAASIHNWSKTKGKTNGKYKEDWWGRNDRKWHYLCKELLANDRNLAQYYQQLCKIQNQQERGVIEWCLCMGEALKIANDSPSVMIVRYEDLISHPETTLKAVFQHAKLDADETVLKYAKSVVNAPSASRKFEINPLYSEHFFSIMNRLGYAQ